MIYNALMSTDIKNLIFYHYDLSKNTLSSNLNRPYVFL